MSNAAKLKKRAVELEQKKQFDKALALYIQFLEESGAALDDIDIPLYNRVGDLMLRTGNASDALNYYEKAVDLYAERGFHNNAIALCNKVLRQSPGRTSIYYKLGKISATKGFKSDAKKNFLEYADRMQKAGQINEAFRALKEFADLCPDQDDIRLMLAEQLTKENRQDEALEQLQKLHDKLDSEGRTAEARATVDRMKSIDPEAVPRVSGAYRPQKSTDLIFLDTSFEQSTRRGATPAPAARAGRPVSDPDLVLLTLADQPDAPVSPVHNSAVADAFALETAEPNEEGSAGALPLLDVSDALPSADDLDAELELVAAPPSMGAEPAVVPLDFELASTTAESPASETDLDIAALDVGHDADTDTAVHSPVFEPGAPLSVDYAGDLAAEVIGVPENPGNDLFDFRGPPRADDDPARGGPPPGSLDPDVSFPGFDLDDMSLPSADEVTSGASLAAALGAADTLGIDAGDLDGPAGHQPSGAEIAGALDAAIGRAEPTPEGDLDLEWPAAAPATPVDASALAASIDDLIVADAADAPTTASAVETRAPNVDAPGSEFAIEEPAVRADTPASAADTIDDISIDDLVEAHGGAADRVAAEDESDERFTTESSPEAPVIEAHVAAPAVDARAVPQTPAETPVARAPASGEEREPAAANERMAGWEVQRALAERLLESGDRAAGVRVLEEVAAELERIGDLERALTIVDELIRLSPDSIRHHQKRVELAFRSNDRVKLIEAYLELGDALFRAGEERKARAVYQRVHELAPDDPRARAAIESVSSTSPPAGSGAIPAIAAPQPANGRHEPPAARSEARDPRGAPPPSASNGARANGVSAPPPSRKPSPLDRSAASNGEFVDLGEWLRSGENPKSTRMVAEEKPPTGDEQADFQEMLKRFKQGVAENVDDEDYESHYDLGVAYKEMGLIDEAVAEFQKALRGTTQRVRAYEALGQCFVEKEQYQVAASVLGRAIALGEGDDHHLVGVLYLLGRAVEALGRNRDALDYYQRVFAVDIEFRDVAERIIEIERKAT
jgi:tetratricopeptide (TPR) repeat protein